MKFLPLVALLALTGCQTTYTKLTVTDLDSKLISEWVAEGPVRRIDQGYKIRAVERFAAGPFPVKKRFPNGWRTTVVGANILLEKIEKPAWLVAVDAGEPMISEDTEGTASEDLEIETTK